jgi:hypothetical protein
MVSKLSIGFVVAVVVKFVLLQLIVVAVVETQADIV